MHLLRRCSIETGEAIALRDYDTRELDTTVGEIVTLDYPQDDGWWAENAAGQSGWIPAPAIEFIDGKPPSSL